MSGQAKTVLVTGVAGFIGFHLARLLKAAGHSVVGLDDLNHYYDPTLKVARLAQLQIHLPDTEESELLFVPGEIPFYRADICNRNVWERIALNHKIDIVVHLAAQAGVRYSLENPDVYVHSNVDGFLQVLEYVRHQTGVRLLYASSSSVYGKNAKIPFSTSDRVDEPVSLYAATKRANELMAFTYHNLYGIPVTGLRFFTVYGPWGRPDMAYFDFTNRILSGQPIRVFNNGNMYRDFTYVDDICKAIERMIGREDAAFWQNRLFNIGNNAPVRLMDMIEVLEKTLGCEAAKEFLPIQPGDVERTWADVSDLESEIGYRPATAIEDGLKAFVDWYRGYYHVS